MIRVEKDFHGRKFSIETGRIAKQASGSVVVSMGDSMVLVTACLGGEKPGDFVPLTVDYQEKTYAGGKIPGGFFRREGKLSEREILVSRLIDRPCRPLFPEGFNNELQVVATVVSADPDADPDVLAVTGAGAALSLSEAPFLGPIAAVRVCRVNGKLMINPTRADINRAELNFVVAGTRDAITMVEGGAKEVPEAEVLEALFFAQAELQHLIAMIDEITKKAGKKKVEAKKREIDTTFQKKVVDFLTPLMKKGIRIKDKLERRDFWSTARDEAVTKFIDPESKDAATMTSSLNYIWENTLYTLVRDMIVDEKIRIDGRDFTTVRPITIEVGCLPRTHGSALFTRGETQALVAATLGTAAEAQRLDLLTEEGTKRFMLHYNFPPFSVGETKPMRGPGRREIGHGALAERAISAVIPAEAAFPYVLRVVSEVTESNGSSSMATTCGASLSLMDAGVPLTAPVAGIAMGLIKHNNKMVVLSDILGDEDHLGDMDFKVCGTEKGITALQMDIKIEGLEKEVVRQALDQAKQGRLFVLSQMAAVISTHRRDLSKFAPRITELKIHPDRIKDLIGPGGKTIRSISESCGVKIDVNEAGVVHVAGQNGANIDSAIRIIKSHTDRAEVGKMYKGLVTRLERYGAHVQIFPGQEGVIHISELADYHVEKVSDVVNEGDEVTVKVTGVDKFGKPKLSLKEAKAEAAA